jgi:hypothetical protein
MVKGNFVGMTIEFIKDNSKKALCMDRGSFSRVKLKDTKVYSIKTKNRAWES